NKVVNTKNIGKHKRRPRRAPVRIASAKSSAVTSDSWHRSHPSYTCSTNSSRRCTRNSRRSRIMSKVRPTIGTNGLALPILPPERDERVWAKLVRIMFYTPGFLAMLLLKAGEPEAFGISVELLMLSSAAAIVGGL